MLERILDSYADTNAWLLSNMNESIITVVFKRELFTVFVLLVGIRNEIRVVELIQNVSESALDKLIAVEWASVAVEMLRLPICSFRQLDEPLLPRRGCLRESGDI